MKNLTHKYGFTLMELMVVIIIIAVLAAIAVPQYKKAALKSRFSTVMPMAKSIADAQEVYYQGRQFYALDVDELDVTPVDAENTTVTLSDEDNFNYVIAQRSDVPGNRYIMYQKHSTNFPGNIHCEALTGDTQAEQLCQALGGENIGENGSYTAYLLSGNSASGTFDKECKSTPETEQTCPGGCGIATRTETCDTRTGEWSYGEWSECPVKPAESQECSANNKSGTQTRSVTCDNGAWTTGSWSSCDIPCDNSTKPANIRGDRTNATGTATCVEGEWKYEWTNVREYPNTNSYCEGSYEFACVGANFSGENSRCMNSRPRACAYNTYSGPRSHCQFSEGGMNGCAYSTFSGEGSYCVASGGYLGNRACEGSIFSGDKSYCSGSYQNDCANTEILAGAYCEANAKGACDGANYVSHPQKNSNLTGCCKGSYCQQGSPKCKLDSSGNLVWNNTTHAYDIDGTW